MEPDELIPEGIGLMLLMLAVLGADSCEDLDSGLWITALAKELDLEVREGLGGVNEEVLQRSCKLLRHFPNTLEYTIFTYSHFTSYYHLQFSL